MEKIMNNETKEMVFKDFRQEESHIGYSQTINWISTKWDGGPEKEGEYLVQLNNGDYKTLFCTGSNKGEKLLMDYVHGRDEVTGYYFKSNEELDDDEEELTDSDWISIGRSHRVWYYIDDYTGCEGSVFYEYYILKEQPKYYMSTPINSLRIGEVENVEKEYYCFDNENNFVKEP